MKTLLIIQREYFTRVKKRAFIVTTLLVPILVIALIGGIAFLSIKSIDTKTVAVLDESNYFKNQLEDKQSVKFEYVEGDLETLKKDPQYNAVLFIPDQPIDQLNNIAIYSDDQIGMGLKNTITAQLDKLMMEKKMELAGVDKSEIEKIKDSNVNLQTINNDGEESNSELAYGISYASGFLLYMFMLMYGMSVMRSVMEEKTNRIAEIIVSSVKPFQLMLGKIIGVALVGLTQFFIWIALILLLTTIGGAAIGGLIGASPEALEPMMGQQGGTPEINNIITNILSGANWLQIISWFVFYFLGGYFLYASLFAAVGSLVNEDAQDSQQLTLPITMPIILGFVIMTFTLEDSNSPIAIFGSMFPLTSPLVMMARIPFGVPGWQLALSALFLILGFIGTTWLAAKIYRTGILLYGKKVTLKELGKWLVRK